jgi:membrane fusion protein, multidrug efflux system
MRAHSALLSVVVLSALLAACGRDQPAQEPVRPAIAVQPVPLASLAIETYAGDVRARHQSSPGFRIAGKIEARLVDNGARVRKGQVLARLVPDDAQLASNAADAAVASAEADLVLAQAELSRHQQLLDKKYISQALFDARFNSAKAAEARLTQARAQAAVSRNQSGYTELRASADGVVTQVLADIGQVVSAGQPVFTVSQGDAKEVAIDVPESRHDEFKADRPLIIELWSSSGKRYVGKVREVGGGADPVTRTYAVRVSFEQPDADVQLGMTARVYFTDSQAPESLLIPLSALHEKEGKPAVWLIDATTRKTSLQPVTVGRYREDGVTITEGLLPTHWIVAAGAHKVVGGQRVYPVDRDNKPVLP